MKDPKTYDGLSALVFFIGLYEGLIPLAAKLFDWNPFLAFPLRLPSPAWWIVSVAVLVVTAVLLAVIDSAKKRAT